MGSHDNLYRIITISLNATCPLLVHELVAISSFLAVPPEAKLSPGPDFIEEEGPAPQRSGLLSSENEMTGEMPQPRITAPDGGKLIDGLGLVLARSLFSDPI